MSIEERRYDTLDAAARALAANLAESLRAAITNRGEALIAVSGGSTPQHVFEHLRQEELNWARVTVTLTDERWVPGDHPESNERLVRSFLLQGRAAAAGLIPLYGGEASPAAGLSACEARLAATARPFDAVYLGMGDDGHFASLFPGAAAADVRDRLCVAVPGSESRMPRMSLTAPAILDSKKVFLLFSGAGKHAMYASARKEGPYKDIPLRLVLLQERTPVSVLMAP